MTTVVGIVLLAVPALAQEGAPPSEFRQIITYQFQPGTLQQVQAIYERQLLPAYEAVTALLNFRGYFKTESPTPFDLIAVSAYQGLAGMDRAKEEMKKVRAGVTPALVYAQIARLTHDHRDEIVEMLPAPASDIPPEQTHPDAVIVFEYIRLVPAAHGLFEQLIYGRVRPFEKDKQLYQWSETARMVISDGWDYLRIFSVRSLAEWQNYIEKSRGGEFQPDLAPLILSKKTMILRPELRLSVR